MEVLTENSVYKSKSLGNVIYLGTDSYMGQHTYHFKSIDYGTTTYILPHTLESFLCDTDHKEK